MKKILYILFASLLSVGATSCLNDVLEVENPSEYEPNVVFSSYTYAENVIFSIYQQYTIDKSYRNRFLNYYGGNTDCEWFNSAKEGDVKTNLWSYHTSVTEGNQMNESDGCYSVMYMAIEYANQAIQGLRLYGDVENRPEMAALLGEALTLRAQFYYDLIKAWGDVPARFEPVTSETIYIPRTDRDVIYKQLIVDLQEAQNYVYWPTQASQTMTTGRVNKAFTKGLLARICLTAAGYSWRPDEGKTGTGNAGSNRRSSLTEAGGEWAGDALYQIALNACKDVIAQENVYCRLSDNFKKIWTDMMQYKNFTAGEEALFVIPFGHKTLRGQWNWNFAIRHNKADDHVGKDGYGGSVGPVPTMFYEYTKNDERRDLTCVNFEWSSSKNSVQVPAGFNKWYFGKYRYEWMPDDVYIASNDDGIMPIVMRYADVLLMAAEAANEMGDEGYAREQLRKVRLRAYKSNKTEANNYVDALSGHDAIFNAIVEERGLEFCGEMLRKSDLIRWGILGKSIDETKAKMRALRSHTTFTSSITGRVYDYSTVGTNLYYRYVGDANPNTNMIETIEMYGLGYGEAGVPEGTGWIKWADDESKEEEYIKEGKLKDERIDLISQAGDAAATDQKMYWPLFSAIMSTNFALANDYGY